MLFYNLDQIVCVGACVGEVKKQARQLKVFIPDFKLAIAFLVSQRTSYLKEIKFEILN
jgi:hypothetical protein